MVAPESTQRSPATSPASSAKQFCDAQFTYLPETFGLKSSKFTLGGYTFIWSHPWRCYTITKKFYVSFAGGRWYIIVKTSFRCYFFNIIIYPPKFSVS